MAANTEVVASSADPLPTSPSMKRQQSLPSSQHSPQPAKHPRLSTGSAESPSTLCDSPKPADKSDIQKPADRKNSTQEEHKRGQRLFGGLLSALSQSSTGTQQKRRQDIEKQQQERAKRQKLEDEGRQQEKLQILKELRTQEMVGFKEKSMRLKHTSILATAHCLQTKSEPKLCYKPWKLLPEDVEHIKRQVEEAEATIAQELKDLNARKGTAQKHSEEPKPQAEAEAKTEDEQTIKGEKGTEPLPDSIITDSTNDLPATTTTTTTTTQISKDNHEGEVVLEVAEDMVIY